MVPVSSIWAWFVVELPGRELARLVDRRDLGVERDVPGLILAARLDLGQDQVALVEGDRRRSQEMLPESPVESPVTASAPPVWRLEIVTSEATVIVPAWIVRSPVVRTPPCS